MRLEGESPLLIWQLSCPGADIPVVSYVYDFKNTVNTPLLDFTSGVGNCCSFRQLALCNNNVITISLLTVPESLFTVIDRHVVRQQSAAESISVYAAVFRHSNSFRPNETLSSGQTSQP